MNNIRVTKTQGHQDTLSEVASCRPKVCDLRLVAHKKIIAALLIFGVVWLILPQPAQAATTWAYPDSNTVSGTVCIGVVAYHANGIDNVAFSIKNTNISSIVEKETLNPETKEYEYVFMLDTAQLADDQNYVITATANPINGIPHQLPELIIQVDNSPDYKTWYVDVVNGNDTTGDGSPDKPLKTVGRALGTQWEWHTAVPRVESGDTVKLKSGTYSLPDGQYATFTKYVTIMPDDGAMVYMSGGTLRSSFLKFQSINFFHNGTIGGVTSLTGHHLWFKDCTYTGLGKIWPDTGNIDEAFRSRDTSAYVILENFTVHDANQGLSLIGQGNYIMRNCHVYDQNGDGAKFMGDNVLITGNYIHDIAAPAAWSVCKNSGPYNFGQSADLIFYLSTDYGATFPQSFTVNLAGMQTVDQLVTTLNNDSNFAANFVASISAAPYPYPGGLKIEGKLRREQHQFYVEGSANTILNLSDNARALNDISQAHPAKHSTDHCDCIANDDRDANNVIIRKNKLSAERSQGLKLDGINRTSIPTDFYKRNIAIVNNLITGTDQSARLLYFSWHGSGTPSSILHWENFLIEHNTIFKPEDGLVRSAFTIDLGNPDIKDFIIRNNIIGKYHSGDWSLADQNKGISDYNLFYPTKHGGGTLSAHSQEADPQFVDISNEDYRILETSPAKDLGISVSGIKYDLNWNLRDAQPDVGAYEYGNTTFLYGDVSGDSDISAYDAALTAQAAVDLITLTPEQFSAADVDGSTDISAYDAALIAQYSVGLISKFPVEGG